MYLEKISPAERTGLELVKQINLLAIARRQSFGYEHKILVIIRDEFEDEIGHLMRPLTILKEQ
jgi:hypothetical protein